MWLTYNQDLEDITRQKCLLLALRKHGISTSSDQTSAFFNDFQKQLMKWVPYKSIELACEQNMIESLRLQQLGFYSKIDQTFEHTNYLGLFLT